MHRDLFAMMQHYNILQDFSEFTSWKKKWILPHIPKFSEALSQTQIAHFQMQGNAGLERTTWTEVLELIPGVSHLILMYRNAVSSVYIFLSHSSSKELSIPYMVPFPTVVLTITLFEGVTDLRSSRKLHGWIGIWTQTSLVLGDPLRILLKSIQWDLIIIIILGLNCLSHILTQQSTTCWLSK